MHALSKAPSHLIDLVLRTLDYFNWDFVSYLFHSSHIQIAFEDYRVGFHLPVARIEFDGFRVTCTRRL